jgi:hypothetical protein
MIQGGSSLFYICGDSKFYIQQFFPTLKDATEIFRQSFIRIIVAIKEQASCNFLIGEGKKDAYCGFSKNSLNFLLIGG